MRSMRLEAVARPRSGLRWEKKSSSFIVSQSLAVSISLVGQKDYSYGCMSRPAEYLGEKSLGQRGVQAQRLVRIYDVSFFFT